MHSRCGRADLLRALASKQQELLVSMAALLGYCRDEPVPEPEEKGQKPQQQPTPEPELDDLPEEFEPLPFWRLERHEALAPLEMVERFPEPESPERGRKPAPPFDPPESAEHRPLATWRKLGPRLRQRAASRVDGHALDVKQVVHHLSRGDQLQHLPRKQYLSFGRSLYVIRDRSLRLVPYWRDQDLVVRWLRRLLPAGGVERADFF